MALMRQLPIARVTVAAMRWLLILVLGIALALGATSCGESGPSGPDARAVEEFEGLELSQEEAEAEVAAADREAAEQSRKDLKRIHQEVSEEDASTAKRKAGPDKQTPAQAAGFEGKYEEAYEVGLFACGFYPLKRIAKEFGISPYANEVEVAEAYGEGYYGRFEQAAFEGCFDGIRKRQSE